MHRNCWALIGGLTLFALGCGGQPMGKVEGTVTFDGQPIADGTIILETTGARPATGKIVNGKIVEVTTHEENDGAAVGSHRVAVQAVAGSAAPPTAGGDNPGVSAAASLESMKTTSLLPAKYGNPETSGLTAEIKAGVNTLDLQLKKDAE